MKENLTNPLFSHFLSLFLPLLSLSRFLFRSFQTSYPFHSFLSSNQLKWIPASRGADQNENFLTIFFSFSLSLFLHFFFLFLFFLRFSFTPFSSLNRQLPSSKATSPFTPPGH